MDCLLHPIRPPVAHIAGARKEKTRGGRSGARDGAGRARRRLAAKRTGANDRNYKIAPDTSTALRACRCCHRTNPWAPPCGPASPGTGSLAASRACSAHGGRSAACRGLDRPGEWAGRRGCVGCRSEEHTSELQSLRHLVCRLLLEKKTKSTITSE